MMSELPPELKSLQPSDFTQVETGDATLFILWPEAAALKAMVTSAAKLPGYPFGTFPSGDIVCHADGKLFVVLHDTMESIECKIPPQEFIERLNARDVTLEVAMYAE